MVPAIKSEYRVAVDLVTGLLLIDLSEILQLVLLWSLIQFTRVHEFRETQFDSN